MKKSVKNQLLATIATDVKSFVSFNRNVKDNYSVYDWNYLMDSEGESFSGKILTLEIDVNSDIRYQHFNDDAHTTIGNYKTFDNVIIRDSKLELVNFDYKLPKDYEMVMMIQIICENGKYNQWFVYDNSSNFKLEFIPNEFSEYNITL